MARSAMMTMAARNTDDEEERSLVVTIIRGEEKFGIVNVDGQSSGEEEKIT